MGSSGGEQVRSLVEIIQTGAGPPKRTVSLAGTADLIRPWSVGGDWVGKTDLMDYYRCPYAYSLLYRGEIGRKDLVAPGLRRLLAAGVEFHEQVDRAVPQVGITSAEELAALLTEEVIVLHPPVCVNEKLMLYGRPDGIDPRRGAFWPIEYKTRQAIRHSDKIELAFYWLVLAALRTGDSSDPGGIVVVRRDDGQPSWIEVALDPDDFAQVYLLLDGVRRARRIPVVSPGCRCNVCSTVRRNEVRAAAIARKDLTLLSGIKRHYAQGLRAAGVRDWADLLRWDRGELVTKIRGCSPRRPPAVSMIARWQWQARAHETGTPQLRGRPRPIPTAFVVVDLEYLTGPGEQRVWLAGVAVVTDLGPPRVHQFWADDNDAAERQLFIALAETLDAHGSLPVVTWGGDAADLPRTRKAAVRLGVPDPFADRTHRDLCRWAKDHVCLPGVFGYGLKAVGSYFSFSRDGDIATGLQALNLYREYVQLSGEGLDDRTTTIKSQLMTYNREDLQATIHVAEKLREFC
jgi:predicted RecB family nuclease